MRLRGNSITGSNINSGIMNNTTNNHHDNNNGEERPSSHFSNYYGGSKPPDVSSSSTPKRKTTGRRKSNFTTKLFSSSKPTNNNNHNESSQQQQNREMLFSADGMLPDPRCEMRAMIECQQQQQHQHQQQRSEYYYPQQHLKPGVYAANNNNVSAAERFKYGDGNNNIPQNRAAEEVTEHNDDTHHHEHDDIIAVTNSANRFKFGIQQLQQYDIRRGSGGSVSTLTRSSAGEDTFHTPSPPGATAAAAANRNLMIGKSPFANYKIDDDNDENCDDHDDGGGRQPYTRPSCPQYKRTTNMGLSTPAAKTTTTTSSSGSCSNMNNGYCAFDVNATRAELLSKLEGKRRGGGGGGPTLKCSTVQEIDEDLLRERESTPSSSFFTQTQTSPPPEFRGSLRDCLIGMGFDDDAIIKAMVACNASESKDVENVIEWLDDHREVVGVGEGAVRSGDAYYHHHHDNNNNNNNKINHESFCDEESHYTQTSLHTRTSHGTAQTEESNEEIRILAHSLKDLGFDHVEIREKKELYRRASKNNGLLNAEGFIAAMFEVDDEIVGSSRVVKSRVKSEPLLAGDDHDDNHDGNNDWKRSASLSHHRKLRNQTDSELFSFLSAMGFSMEKIESAIQSLRNEGTNVIIDAEAVVAVLLSQQHEEKSRSSSGGALLPLVTLDNSHGGSSKTTTTADELEQNEFMKIEVTPGNFAPVLKARQTVQAISDGTAVSVRCTVCSVTLQCCPDAEYVLCPDCDVVSPILSQYRRRLASSDRVAGSDGSSSQSSHHSARSNRRMSTGGMIGAIGLGKKSRR